MQRKSKKEVKSDKEYGVITGVSEGLPEIASNAAKSCAKYKYAGHKLKLKYSSSNSIQIFW